MNRYNNNKPQLSAAVCVEILQKAKFDRAVAAEIAKRVSQREKDESRGESEDSGASNSESPAAPPAAKKVKRSAATVEQSSEREHEGDAESSIDARHLAQDLKALKEIGRHFSKIANRFAFEDNTAAYQVWAIQFKAELLNSDLDAILTSDPRASNPEDRMADPELYAQQQKTVFHMIFQCVPKAKLSVVVTLPQDQHTGYDAWKALRVFYIGDEQAYLASLESKFQRVCWEGAEAFPTFETRFDSLLNELLHAGAGKAEHVKKSALMSAVEESPHRDALGNSAFVRLNTISKIHLEKPYRDWITAIRIEAQQIEDSLHKKGAKRGREEHTHKETSGAQEVSFVASSAAPPSNRDRRGPPFHARRGGEGAGGSQPLCHNMQNTGRCRFGTSCRYSHKIPPHLLGKSDREGPNGGGANTASKAACLDFQRGKCNRGERCKFSHAPSSNSGVPMQEGLQIAFETNQF